MQRQLEGGLILRSISEGHDSDREDLAQFYVDTFGESGDDTPGRLGAWTRTLLSGNHPTVTHDDIWVVVDSEQNDKIVSAVLLIPQTWHYDDIPVGVGRIELVATNKDYRRRGLVRAQIEAAHERSAELGHLMQGITGIPHYYRRFGYGMAVDLGIRNTLPLSSIPKLENDQQPKFILRPAVLDDAEQLAMWDDYRVQTSRLSMIRTPHLWRFELEGRDSLEAMKAHTQVIVSTQGEAVGYVSLQPSSESISFSIFSYVIGEKASYLETFDDVMRGAKAFAEDYYRERPEFMPTSILFDSGMPEAVDHIVQATPGGQVLPDLYAWYLRVPDLAAFIQHVAPVLEARLSGSGANAYNGTLKIGMYDLTGLEITFERGKLADVVYRKFDLYEGDVSFPFYSFLNVLFGHRTQAELYHIYPEARANKTARVLLDALFPKQRSWLVGLG